MALPDIKRERLMLADNVRVVGEEVWPGGTREPIQHFGARPFDEMPRLETASPSRPRPILRIRIDLAAGEFEERPQPPSARLQGAHVCAGMRVAFVQVGSGIDKSLGAPRPACRGAD